MKKQNPLSSLVVGKHLNVPNTRAANLFEQIPVPKYFRTLSIEHLLLEKTTNLKVISCEFEWNDICELESLIPYSFAENSPHILKNDTNNVAIINHTEHQLVVTNDVSDLIIVNTNDALFVSKIGTAFNIKNIIREHNENYSDYFDHSPIHYRPWGTYELIYSEPTCRVKKVYIAPGKSLSLHKHSERHEYWTIISGIALITIDGSQNEYSIGDHISAGPGQSHQLANPGTYPLIIIEISVGSILTEEDIINIVPNKPSTVTKPMMVRLLPAFKDYLWGGTKLRDIYHKQCDYDIIAESWELSAHPAGQSIIAEGPYSGMYFGDYINRIGPDALGWKCQAFEEFPLLVKFIDAKNALSIQVHPNDEYALSNENEYGKNELWYIMDCDENATLYCGVKTKVSRDEILQRVGNNTLTDILNEVKVKKGDAIFVEAGTIHAIGKGIMICEIQQSSNSTYRLYDYGRRDKFGNLRELHLDKALDVVNLEPSLKPVTALPSAQKFSTYTEQILCQCKYFESIKYDINSSLTFSQDESSFFSINHPRRKW